MTISGEDNNVKLWYAENWECLLNIKANTFGIMFSACFLYDNESKGLVQFLVASTKRAYYLSSVNLYDMDIILNDKYYYGEGQELALLTETYEKLSTLENDLKNGKYGGKSASGYPFFKQFHNNPGCIRSDMVKYHYNCTNRAFDEYYTKELAESSTDYLMIEYLNKLNEFINNPPVGKKYDLNNSTEIKSAFKDVIYNVYIQLFNKMADDIKGHIDKMNEIGSHYVFEIASAYRKYTLYAHGICTFLIFITFFIFSTSKFKYIIFIHDNINIKKSFK